MSLLLQLNYALFQEINSPAGQYPWLDGLMIFCANYLVFCLPLLLLLMWGRPVNWRGQALNADEQVVLRERRAATLWVAIACLAAYGINLLIEQFLFEPRPFISHHVHQLISHPADGSFPSDHTAWAFAVAGMFLLQLLPAWQRARQQQRTTGNSSQLKALIYPGLITLLALVAGCVIGFARVFVGVHYPGDILGGACDGLIAAIVMTLIRSLLSRPTNAVLRFAGTIRLA
jgi:undecaprenyl-diphosphatase